MDRRHFVSSFLIVGAATIVSIDVLAGPVRRARRRIRRRIRVRRRIRRPAITRIVLGRPYWVVPVGLAIGWELAHAGRVVLVKEIRTVEKDGTKTEVATVQDASGKSEQVAITREDTADNAKDLEGSLISDDDKTTPGIDAETEVEEQGEN
jgi:hypothetical protein